MCECARKVGRCVRRVGKVCECVRRVGKVCECVRKVRRCVCVWGGELTYNSSDTSKLVSEALTMRIL